MRLFSNKNDTIDDYIVERLNSLPGNIFCISIDSLYSICDHILSDGFISKSHKKDLIIKVVSKILSFVNNDNLLVRLVVLRFDALIDQSIFKLDDCLPIYQSLQTYHPAIISDNRDILVSTIEKHIGDSLHPSQWKLLQQKFTNMKIQSLHSLSSPSRAVRSRLSISGFSPDGSSFSVSGSPSTKSVQQSSPSKIPVVILLVMISLALVGVLWFVHTFNEGERRDVQRDFSNFDSPLIPQSQSGKYSQSYSEGYSQSYSEKPSHSSPSLQKKKKREENQGVFVDYDCVFSTVSNPVDIDIDINGEKEEDLVFHIHEEEDAFVIEEDVHTNPNPTKLFTKSIQDKEDEVSDFIDIQLARESGTSAVFLVFLCFFVSKLNWTIKFTL